MVVRVTPLVPIPPCSQLSQEECCVRQPSNSNAPRGVCHQGRRIRLPVADHTSAGTGKPDTHSRRLIHGECYRAAIAAITGGDRGRRWTRPRSKSYLPITGSGWHHQLIDAQGRGGWIAVGQCNNGPASRSGGGEAHVKHIKATGIHGSSIKPDRANGRNQVKRHLNGCPGIGTLQFYRFRRSYLACDYWETGPA